MDLCDEFRLTLADVERALDDGAHFPAGGFHGFVPKVSISPEGLAALRARYSGVVGGSVGQSGWRPRADRAWLPTARPGCAGGLL
jgi:hypothetical protein